MNCLMSIKKLTYQKENKRLLNNINLTINPSETIAIIGSPASGKTTLANFIYDHYNNVKNNNHNSIPIAYIKDHYEFEYDLVQDEIKHSLKNINKEKETNTTLKQVCSYLNIKPDMNISDLNETMKVKFYIINQLINQPKLIIVDQIISLLNKEDAKKIIEYLLKLNIESKTTLIHITNDSELLKYTKRIIVMDKGKIIDDFENKDLINHQKVLEQIGMNLPFLMDLSTRLNYYNLLEKKYLDRIVL